MAYGMKAPRTSLTNFLQSCEKFASATAIDIRGEETTYKDLANRAKSLGATVTKAVPSADVALTAVFAYRSQTAYAGVLGALLAGHGYVPLNPTFPVERTRLMLEKSRCSSIIIDAGSEPQLERLLAGFQNSLLVLCPDRSGVTE